MALNPIAVHLLTSICYLSSRYEFLEILARVKVPKIQCWRELRTPCNSRDLDYRNRRLLYPKDKIPSSAFHSALMSFQEKRKIAFDELSPAESRLNIPGRIIHLVHAMDRKGVESKKYLPYWESRKALREISLSVEIMVCFPVLRLIPCLARS